MKRYMRGSIAGVIAALTLAVAPLAGMALADEVPAPATSPDVPVTAIPVAESPAPSESPAATPEASAPDAAGIPPAELLNAWLDIPIWANQPAHEFCPAGHLKFTDGVFAGKVRVYGQPQQVDVDRDGDLESVVWVFCKPQTAFSQVLVFDRAADGGIVLVDAVVVTQNSPA